jgi:hypothetical protein
MAGKIVFREESGWEEWFLPAIGNASDGGCNNVRCIKEHEWGDSTGDLFE